MYTKYIIGLYVMALVAKLNRLLNIAK